MRAHIYQAYQLIRHPCGYYGAYLCVQFGWVGLYSDPCGSNPLCSQHFSAISIQKPIAKYVTSEQYSLIFSGLSLYPPFHSPRILVMKHPQVFDCSKCWLWLVSKYAHRPGCSWCVLNLYIQGCKSFGAAQDRPLPIILFSSLFLLLFFSFFFRILQNDKALCCPRWRGRDVDSRVTQSFKPTQCPTFVRPVPLKSLRLTFAEQQALTIKA